MKDLTEPALSHTAENLLHGLLVDDADGPCFSDDPPTLRQLPAGSPLEESFTAVLERYPVRMSKDRRVMFHRYEPRMSP